MLPKRFRLKDAILFQEAFRSGKSFFFEGVACKVLFFGKKTQIGFSISKKLFPRAVDRNRMKRLLADAVYRIYLEIPTGTRIVFFFGKKMTMNRDDAQKAISEIIRKVNEIKKQAI